MVSLALFLAAFSPLSTRYGFPSGNSLTAPIDAKKNDAPATVTPVSCKDAFSPPPHRAGLWASDLWNLSTPNAEEAQSPFSLGFVDNSRCGHVSPFVGSPPQHATSDGRWPAAIQRISAPDSKNRPNRPSFARLARSSSQRWSCSLWIPMVATRRSRAGPCTAGLRILILRRADACYWRPSAWAFTLSCVHAAAHTACASCLCCWCGP